MKKIILLMMSFLLLTLSGCSGINEKNPDEKVDKQILNFVNLDEPDKAYTILERNPSYTVRNKELAEKILSAYQSHRVDEQSWILVIKRIDGTIDPEIESKKNQIFLDRGFKNFHSYSSYDEKKTDAKKYWSWCAEGSKGNILSQSVDLILNRQYLEAGKLLRNSMTDEEIENFEKFIVDDIENNGSQSLNEYLKRTLCSADIAGFQPVSNLEELTVPGGRYRVGKNFKLSSKEIGLEHEKDDNEYLKMPEEIRNYLTKELKENAKGNKVLVLNRIHRFSEDKSNLYIDGYLMRSLPEEYCAEDISEVGYILLMDYDYMYDDIWYAGIVTVTMYDITTDEPIYTSKNIGNYDRYYYGVKTDVIFSGYPDSSYITKKAISAIS